KAVKDFDARHSEVFHDYSLRYRRCGEVSPHRIHLYQVRCYFIHRHIGDNLRLDIPDYSDDITICIQEVHDLPYPSIRIDELIFNQPCRLATIARQLTFQDVDDKLVHRRGARLGGPTYLLTKSDRDIQSHLFLEQLSMFDEFVHLHTPCGWVSHLGNVCFYRGGFTNTSDHLSSVL